MYCPNCGTENEDGGKFCVKCGMALPSIQPQGALPAKPQVAGMACHYPGCTEPVIGQCPGYKGACLRFYCAIHSVEPYCSICAEKIARDVAIEAVYQDYLKAAESVWKKRFGLGAFLVWFVLILLSSMSLEQAYGVKGAFVPCLSIGIVGLIAIWALYRANYQKALNMVSAERPGFREFYTEYVKQRQSETMAKVLTGLLVAGAAAKAIDDYRMRQDVRALLREMKK